MRQSDPSRSISRLFFQEPRNAEIELKATAEESQSRVAFQRLLENETSLNKAPAATDKVKAGMKMRQKALSKTRKKRTRMNRIERTRSQIVLRSREATRTSSNE